jgi:hypothetical protein
MSWAQENKFLTGVVAVTVVGAGVLGYFTYTAMAKYGEASATLEQTAAEKRRLETQPVYPNAANLKKLQAQKQEHLARIQDLQKKLNAMAIPEEQISPEGFQDRLRSTVTSYVKAAATARMKLPEKFYYGFDIYQTTTPKTEAAPKLDRQLKAMEFVLNQLPKNGAIELRKIEREQLPEETGRPAKRAEPPKSGQKKPAGVAAAPDTSLVTKHSFEIVFLSDQTAVPATLNAITKAKNQFYVTRNLVVKNEKPAPPPRETAPPASPSDPVAATPAAAPAADGAPAAPAAPVAYTFIVGEERVETTLLIEITEFAPLPEKKDAKGAKGQKPK